MDRAADPVGAGWPARPSPPPAEGPGGQLPLFDVLEQAGRCRRCRRDPAVVGRYCVRCCRLADPVEATDPGEGEGQATPPGDGVATPPDPPRGAGP